MRVKPPPNHVGVFGADTFGVLAERFARFFGTAKFICGQTLIIILWIAMNTYFFHRFGMQAFDKYPFILLNLVFSTQAAYAAPLILLAQTRQADRDKIAALAEARHREEIAALQNQMLAENTELTRQVHTLLEQNTQMTQTLHDMAINQATPSNL